MRRCPAYALGCAALVAAGLAWPWPPRDLAPPGAIRGAAAATLRLAPPQPVIPGVIGHWRFDDGSGLSAAPARGAYPLTAANASGWAWTTGQRAGGVQWSGGTAPLSAALWPTLAGAQRIVIAGWFRGTTYPYTIAVAARSGVAPYGGVFLGAQAGRWYAVANCGETSYGQSATATDVLWHWVVLLYDGTATGNAARLRLQIDGAAVPLSYTGTVPAAVCDAQSPPLRVGWDAGGIGASTGIFDDLWLIVGTVPTAAQLDAMRWGRAQ